MLGYGPVLITMQASKGHMQLLTIRWPYHVGSLSVHLGLV